MSEIFSFKELRREILIMKIVFVGSQNRVRAYDDRNRCGCACNSTLGALASNKPSVQVG